MKNKLLAFLLLKYKYTLGILLIIACYMWLHNQASPQETVDNTIQKTSQNLHDYTNQIKGNTLPLINQDKLLEKFKEKFFLPWSNPLTVFHEESILDKQIELLRRYSENPGWGVDLKPIDTSFIKKLEENVNINEFDGFNTKKPAITTRITNLRILPTHLPTFTNLVDPGEGFPFDNFQVTSLHLNLPIFVLHTTKDKKWSLIITPNKSYGWISSEDLVILEKEFIDTWVNSKFVTAVEDRISALDNSGMHNGTIRIGNIHPIASEGKDYFEIKMAHRNQFGKASIKFSKIPKSKMWLWPIPTNAKNIATVSNNLIGQPYGWGGYMELKDCSAMLMDLFAGFAVWLPKNSRDQNYEGSIIPLIGLNEEEKKEYIKKYAIPFLSFLYLRGHIMLYIGTIEKEIYVFNTIWGLKTKRLFNTDGRAIIGSTVVMPLSIGKENSRIKSNLLNRISNISTVGI